MDLFAKLLVPETRQEAGQGIACVLRADTLIIFDFDTEVRSFLPSNGFRQTIRSGRTWRTFINLCEKYGIYEQELPSVFNAQPVWTVGKIFGGSVWVLQGAGRDAFDLWPGLDSLALPLAGMLQNERRAFRQGSQNFSLQELTDDLRVHTEALGLVRKALNRALSEAERCREAAERANEAKSEFLANMSHEIRTPLGAIVGFTSLLRDPELPESERVAYLDAITRSGTQLSRTIDDILDIAKIESGHMELEKSEFSFIEMMNDILQMFVYKTREKEIFLEYQIGKDVPDLIETDPVRLRQILVNIIGNAVKFTTQGGVKVHVRAESDAHSLSQTIYVFVKDSGCGISQEQSARLFRPFMQADSSTSRRYGGTGLGLALSRRLAQALNGHLKLVESDLSVGSTFLISFSPMVKKHGSLQRPAVPPPSRTEGPAVIAAELKDLRILVVDDSPDNLFLMDRMLTKNGAIVDVASSGAEGIKKALTGWPDVVLMDIQMPGMDGYEALRGLRHSQFSAPVLALTAHAMKEERDRALAAGFSGHVAKPVNREELLRHLRTVPRRDAVANSSTGG